MQIAPPARAAAARKNGAKGGRPAGALPPDLQTLLGSPPMDDPLKQTGWAANVLLLLTRARLEGHPDIDSLAREVRANFGVMAKLIPHDLLFKAQRALQEEQEGRDVDDGPTEEVVDGDDGSSPALRSDPT
ncbi:MAG: hypothetical protein M3Q39_16835 [Actinomycetota bacterium]|nr:hypothetical protein [Actinomycetota bacterium]